MTEEKGVELAVGPGGTGNAVRPSLRLPGHSSSHISLPPFGCFPSFDPLTLWLEVMWSMGGDSTLLVRSCRNYGQPAARVPLHSTPPPLSLSSARLPLITTPGLLCRLSSVRVPQSSARHPSPPGFTCLSLRPHQDPLRHPSPPFRARCSTGQSI